jgi:hypothetical protein
MRVAVEYIFDIRAKSLGGDEKHELEAVIHSQFPHSEFENVQQLCTSLRS